MNRDELLQQSLETIDKFKDIFTKKLNGNEIDKLIVLLKDTMEFGFKQGELCGYVKGLREGAEETVRILEKKVRENAS